MTAPLKISSPETQQFWEIPVLFEDEHLLALDKPARLPAAPETGDQDCPNLTRLLHAAIAAGKPWTRERGLSYLMPAHNLDAGASGVLLLAKSKPVFMKLADWFGADRPGRKYLVLVRDAPREDQFEIEAKLAPMWIDRSLVRVDDHKGKRSRTTFAVVEKFSRWTLLNCESFTDRPHQIRAHLKHAGLPVVGDSEYGGKALWLSRLKPNYRLKPGHDELPLLSRPALHAQSLSLPHPMTSAPWTIEAPLPKDLTVALKYLRKYGTGAAAFRSLEEEGAEETES